MLARFHAPMRGVLGTGVGSGLGIGCRVRGNRFLSTDASSPPASPKHIFADVTIVGGGFVGSVLASLLAAGPLTHRLRILVLEPYPPPPPSTMTTANYDLRTVALSPASKRILIAAGVWSRVEQLRYGSFDRMQVWDACGDGGIVFRASDLQSNVPVNPLDTLKSAGEALSRTVLSQVLGVSGDPEAGTPPPTSSANDAPDTSVLGYVVENRLLSGAAYENVLELTTAHVRDDRYPIPASTSTANPTPLVQVLNSAVETIEYTAAQAASPSSTSSQFATPGNVFPRLTLRDGTRITTSLLVGADGANSQVRASLGLGSVGRDYGQRAAVCTVQVTDADPTTSDTSSFADSNTDNASGDFDSSAAEQYFDDTNVTTAFQRFHPDGPVALLPLGGGVMNVIWSTSPQHADALNRMPVEDFIQVLNSAIHDEIESRPPSPPFHLMSPFSPRTGSSSTSFQTGSSTSSSILPDWLNAVIPPNIAQFIPSAPVSLCNNPSNNETVRPPRVVRLLSGRQSFPLRVSHCSEYVRENVALIGDAAHSVHPLAGQGLNLGLADALALANVIHDALQYGEAIGSYRILSTYEKSRVFDNMTMLASMDVLKHLFCNRSTPITWARNAGLSITDRLPFIKEQFMRRALGEHLDLSRYPLK